MDPASERFADLAERFVAHVDESPLTGPPWLAPAAATLTRLLGAALDLAEVEPTAGRHDDTPRRPTRRARIIEALERDDLYWTVLDPGTFADEPTNGVGSLVDDIEEICSDLEHGLHLWRCGERVDAVWEWRFGHTHHWGPHARAALVVIHDRLR